MFTKFRNRIPEIWVIFAVVIFLLLLPLFVILTVLFDLFPSKERKLFLQNYENYLNKYEGHEFFCYTNRKRYVSVIESKILPEINKSVHIIKLLGKKPETDLEQKYISHALYNIKNVGFPNVIKIIDGKLVDYSLHKKIYDAINNNKKHELKAILDYGFLQLKTRT